jgi:hypothetical protein
MLVIEKTCTWTGGAEGCLGTPDPQFTMNAGTEREMLWCSHCGPQAQERSKLIRRLLDAGYGAQLEAALDIVEGQEGAVRS